MEAVELNKGKIGEKNNAFMIKVCVRYRARNICSKPQLCSIEYIYPTGGGVIRENWNIIYWFIEIRWISFSEFCIFIQLSSSPLNRNVQNILCTNFSFSNELKT